MSGSRGETTKQASDEERCVICHSPVGPFHPVRGHRGEGVLCDDIFGCLDRDRVNLATALRGCRVDR